MTLLDCYLPVFKIVLQMTDDPVSFSDYVNSRHKCITVLEQSMSNAKEHYVNETEKDAVRTAVIAWTDETIMRSDLPWRQLWQSELLQRKYLNITVAGERFFTLLGQLETEHNQARSVFLFCLQQGFCGQYSTPDDQPALLEVIVQQRSLCLPDSWRSWPNEAVITPVTQVFSESRLLHHRPLLFLSVAIMLMYLSIFVFLLHYVS